MLINFAFLTFLIILFPGTQTKDILAIKVKTFDSAGRPSSFIYDEGSIIISCSYKGISTADSRNVVMQRSERFLEPGNATYVGYTWKINTSLLEEQFQCWRGRLRSDAVSVKYILCVQGEVKPRTVCNAPQAYCKVTRSVKTKCAPLTERDCFYGKQKSDINETIGNLRIYPKFQYICVLSGGQGSEKGSGGYCYASIDKPIRNLLSFAEDRAYCSIVFELFLCNPNCNHKTKLKMAGWSHMDLANQFSIYAKEKSTYKLKLNCTAVSSNGTAITEEAQLTEAQKTNLNKFTKELISFSTPTVASIVCVCRSDGKDAIQFYTALLLFKSNKDISYKLEKIKSRRAKRDVVTGVRVQVSTSKGLLVCAQAGKQKCKPNSDKPTANATVPLDTTTFEDYTAFFYIGLFASSPKQKHVLLHHLIVNTTVKGTGTGTIAPVIPGLNGTGTISAETSFSHGPDRSTEVPGTTKESCGVKGSTAIIAVLAVFAVIAVVVIIVLAVLLVKRKKDESRANENEVSATSE